MITGRAEHTATLLPDGKVLVAGGVADNREEEALASAELYDSGTGKWTATGSMTRPRAQHTATLLADGRVLVTGGMCDGRYTTGCPPDEDPTGAMAAAEIYDPGTGKWTPTGDMTTQRFYHTATLLDDGKVLVAGTEHAPDSILASSELFDPAKGKWTATGDMTTGRTQQMATLLPDGRVLIAGGVGLVSPTSHGGLTSAELYDPRSGKWKATGSMAASRGMDPLIVLADGRVLKTGADDAPDPGACELYDPSTGTWSPTGSMLAARGILTSTLLSDGRVLIVAGFAVDVASAELYDPATGTWSDAGSFGHSTFEHAATLLRNGKVLVTGGLLEHDVASAAELYDPASGT